jgi:hypothetical protein
LERPKVLLWCCKLSKCRLTSATAEQRLRRWRPDRSLRGRRPLNGLRNAWDHISAYCATALWKPERQRRGGLPPWHRQVRRSNDRRDRLTAAPHFIRIVQLIGLW